ncbi:protein of unknown function [Shewanella benthica]|uniref:Uncharacterized protein n=1 Tax=Shewanella benthica TaxID=43661 RepID=A0A330M8A4_9GAMM|nr:protein of unknown function [Shewanella benthica]
MRSNIWLIPFLCERLAIIYHNFIFYREYTLYQIIRVLNKIRLRELA